MIIFRYISILIISSIIYLISSVESSAEERTRLILNIGDSYFRSLYMSEVDFIHKEIELIDDLEKTMITIEKKGYTDITKQEIKSLSKEAIVVTNLLLKYLRTSIPLDGDLSALVDDISLKYNKPFDRINSCDLIEHIYYLKYDAGITTVSKKTFINPHKTKCKKFDDQLVEILSLYTHAWIKKVPTSQALSDLSNQYDQLLNSMLKYIASVYSMNLNKATATQMKTLGIERQELIKKALTKKVKKIDKAKENLERYM